MFNNIIFNIFIIWMRFTEVEVDNIESLDKLQFYICTPSSLWMFFYCCLTRDLQ